LVRVPRGAAGDVGALEALRNLRLMDGTQGPAQAAACKVKVHLWGGEGQRVAGQVVRWIGWLVTISKR